MPGDVIFHHRFQRTPNTEAESRWCDAHEAGRHTRNLARKMVADMVEARWHRRRGDVFMLRRMVQDARDARADYHDMLRLCGTPSRGSGTACFGGTAC